MSKQNKRAALILADVIIINIAIIMAIALKNDFITPMTQASFYLSNAIIYTSVKVGIYYFFSLYNSIWSYASIEELIRVILAVLLSTFVGAVYLLTQGNIISLASLVITFMLEMTGISSIRFSYRVFRRIKNKRSITKQDYLKNVLIIGAGSTAGMIAKEMQERPQIHGLLKGYIDDDDSKFGSYFHGAKVLGNKYDIYGVVNHYNIDEIIIAIPSASPEETKEIMKECARCNCKVKTAPGIQEIIDGQVSINEVRDVKIEDLLGRELVELDSSGISSYIHDKIVIVTGGGGSIGSELCRQIAKFTPRKLIILDIYENNAYSIQNELKDLYQNEFEILTLIGSVRDEENIKNIFEKYKPEVVFHAAAHKHVPLMETTPREAILNNCFGTLNVANAANQIGTERFVLISTDKAVNPTNVMGASKRICEMIVQSINEKSKTKFTGVRFGNVLGSNGSVVPLFKKQIGKGGPVTVTHKEVIRYFMTIPEASQLVLQSGAYALGGEIFVLDMGEPVKIYDLALELIRLSGFKPNEEIDIEIIGLRPGEKLFEELLIEDSLYTTDNRKIFIDKPDTLEHRLLVKILYNFKDIIKKNDPNLLREAIKGLVPTYQLNETVNRDFIESKIEEKVNLGQ